MSYVIKDQQKLAAIWAAANAEDWPATYAAAVDALSDPDHPGRPAEGVDIAVYTWISGAQGVNSNQGAFAHYIRDQTKLQYQLRTGETPDDWEERIQNASDKIAENFAKTLLGVDLVNDPDAPLPSAPPTSAVVPSIHDVGLIDAGAAASEVFTDASSTGAPNYSPWAGTALFSYLGDTSFFNDWIANSDTNQFKVESGTYDLIAAAEVSTSMKDVGYVLETLLVGEVPTYLTTLAIGHETIRQAAETARDFYVDSYGSSVVGGGSIIPGKTDIGTAIFNDVADVLTPSGLYKVGTLNDDDITLSKGIIAFNAGAGDDTITVPSHWQNSSGNYGWTVIDGDSGYDVVDYHNLSHGVHLKFDDQGAFDGRAVIEKNGIGLYGFKDGLYNIEEVHLTDHKDSITVNDQILAPSDGLVVDLGKGSSNIDFEHTWNTLGEQAPQGGYEGISLNFETNDVSFAKQLLHLPENQTHDITIDEDFNADFLAASTLSVDGQVLQGNLFEGLESDGLFGDGAFDVSYSLSSDTLSGTQDLEIDLASTDGLNHHQFDIHNWQQGDFGIEVVDTSAADVTGVAPADDQALLAA
ncbi:hypothetical protein [Carnimonas bestiolae]|uniref:hypothetical protein n=1 Tax=Carnimonas bestiolae TaxID=3402172 RepID=UPI003EDBB7F6